MTLGLGLWSMAFLDSLTTGFALKSQKSVSTPKGNRSQRQREIGLSNNGNGLSAKGAKYCSQGQAASEARCVAPGLHKNDVLALKERNKSGRNSGFQCFLKMANYPGATRLASLGASTPRGCRAGVPACAWPPYFRTFGA